MVVVSVVVVVVSFVVVVVVGVVVVNVVEPVVVVVVDVGVVRVNVVVGVYLWAWGSFKDLCSDNDPFCVETRSEFRDWCESTGQVSYTSESGEDVSGVNPSEPIDAIELDLFKEYLSQTPT